MLNEVYDHSALPNKRISQTQALVISPLDQGEGKELQRRKPRFQTNVSKNQHLLQAMFRKLQEILFFFFSLSVNTPFFSSLFKVKYLFFQVSVLTFSFSG